MGSRRNAMGFFGSLDRNERLEHELFGSSTGTTSGINFDKFDDIPVDVSAAAGPDVIPGV